MSALGIEWDDIEPGIYTARIVDAEVGLSGQGNETLYVRMELDGGSAYAFAPFSLLPQAQWKVRKFLRLFGFGKDNEPEPQDLVGLEFEAVFAEDNGGRVSMVDFRALEKPKAKKEGSIEKPKAKKNEKGARSFEL